MIAVVASQSGYGRTNGKPDHAGKNSQAAIKSVIQYFRQFPQADQKKFILYGTSMGATLAAMIATQDTDLAAVILENGIYDVQAGMTNLWFRSQSDKNLSTLYESLDEETKGAYAVRSAILHPEKIKATVLLMAGMGDKVALPDQTIKFHEAIRKAGGRSEMYLFPFAGHSIPEYMKGPAMSQLLHSIKPK
jgi:dipeptidyl aminopeptidase/acylaminoacyl peptidase